MNETRGADGKLRAADKFPSGMKKLAADLHAKKFKFGLYTSQTEKTCAGRAAAYGHEEVDVETYCD
jgi:alpha-galactosidase